MQMANNTTQQHLKTTHFPFVIIIRMGASTVKPLIMDTPIRGQPPYNGQIACPLPLTVHTFLPPTKGQPLNNGQNARRPTCSRLFVQWNLSIRIIDLKIMKTGHICLSQMPYLCT